MKSEGERKGRERGRRGAGLNVIEKRGTSGKPPGEGGHVYIARRRRLGGRDGREGRKIGRGSERGRGRETETEGEGERGRGRERERERERVSEREREREIERDARERERETL